LNWKNYERPNKLKAIEKKIKKEEEKWEEMKI